MLFRDDHRMAHVVRLVGVLESATNPQSAICVDERKQSLELAVAWKRCILDQAIDFRLEAVVLSCSRQLQASVVDLLWRQRSFQFGRVGATSPRAEPQTVDPAQDAPNVSQIRVAASWGRKTGGASAAQAA
ncbi:uncharacterized protein LOC119767105 [Culex quinquefasciatus]|uniref:uncharacterized protein LOC119767105 n=1 Tax=Culex quinquefasciatus TaxID=7176 RepID=UPI0018E3637D|nr:uncharacterized protein LOC119767105 [Culex quinquefasciatus]